MSTSLQRAQVLIDLKRWVPAADELHRELAERPGDPLAHRLLALSLAWQGHLPEARTEVEEAIRLQPDCDHAQQILGWILVKQGHHSEAEKAYWEAIRLNPQESHHFSLLADLCAIKGSWSSCAFVAREGLRINPNSVDCANTLAKALIETNRPKQAQAILDAAMSRDPENCWSHMNQGWIYLTQNKTGESLQHFHEAARINPENTEAHGYIKYLRGKRLEQATRLVLLAILVILFLIKCLVTLIQDRF